MEKRAWCTRDCEEAIRVTRDDVVPADGLGAGGVGVGGQGPQARPGAHHVGTAHLDGELLRDGVQEEAHLVLMRPGAVHDRRRAVCRPQKIQQYHVKIEHTLAKRNTPETSCILQEPFLVHFCAFG